MQTLKLTCPSCGGKLEIDEDIERFACGYCGSEQVVVRKGGVVTLRVEAEASHRTKVGDSRWEFKEITIPLGFSCKSLERTWGPGGSEVFQQTVLAPFNELVTKHLQAEAGAGWQPDCASDFASLYESGRVKTTQTHGFLSLGFATDKYESVSIRLKRTVK